MTPALVIFDCDGVLVDSEAIANRIMAEHITATGVPITYEDCRARFVGGTLQRVMETVEQWLGKPLPPGWKEDFEARRNEAFRRELKAVAGIEEVLAGLTAAETEFCVASSGSFEKMELTLGVAARHTLGEGVSHVIMSEIRQRRVPLDRAPAVSKAEVVNPEVAAG